MRGATITTYVVVDEQTCEAFASMKRVHLLTGTDSMCFKIRNFWKLIVYGKSCVWMIRTCVMTAADMFWCTVNARFISRLMTRLVVAK